MYLLVILVKDHCTHVSRRLYGYIAADLVRFYLWWLPQIKTEKAVFKRGARLVSDQVERTAGKAHNFIGA